MSQTDGVGRRRGADSLHPERRTRRAAAASLAIVHVMRITLVSEDAIRYDATPGMLTVEADTAEQQFSPFHMLGSSLAVCTFSVLASWASHAKIPFEDLAIEVRWTFADHPHRVAAVALRFTWKSLPASRLEAAKRAAALCPIHATLQQGATVSIDGSLT